VQKKLAYYTNETHAPSKWVFLPYQLKAFDENLAILKENNIPYILVQAPITKRLYQSFKNNAQFDDMMRKRGRYTNFNQLMNLDDSLDFYDDDHLNQRGVVKFNTLFISTLLKKK
jgi:hypothetical protein